MSKENIVKLYALLEKDLVLREKALSFQKMYSQSRPCTQPLGSLRKISAHLV